MRKVLTGNPVSEGIALAKAYVYRPGTIVAESGTFEQGQEAAYLEAFQKTADAAAAELREIRQRLEAENPKQAKIFAAHAELLEDEEIVGEIRDAIKTERIYPDQAIERVYSEFAAILSGVDDPLIAGRAADLCDVKNRLLRIYQGKTQHNLSELSEDVIVVAHDLLPSDTATMDRQHVKGIVTEIGGTNSHSAILARIFQIPAVLGVADAVSRIEAGALLVVDAISGTIIQEPTGQEIETCRARGMQFEEQREKARIYLDQPAALSDGTKISIGINIGSAEFEVPQTQFDFVGLFRTEFLYMQRDSFPDEEEQLYAYKRVLANAKGNPVTLRTLDIGGDKELPYMELPNEQNPFLGKRALRLCLSERELFMTQLRAALRASAFGPLQIMFPMVGSMDDLYRAKECVQQAKQELTAQKLAYDENIKLGIMIEIPSIALIADQAAMEVDFASVGSNDLTQYVCAADRMNPELSAYYQSLSPAMLRLLGYVFESFDACGKPVSVCGELAGNPKAAVLLVGLGARKLSMSSGNIAGVKAALAQTSLSEAQDIAKRCKQMETETEIKEFIQK